MRGGHHDSGRAVQRTVQRKHGDAHRVRESGILGVDMGIVSSHVEPAGRYCDCESEGHRAAKG
jgi:hypothetical protein